MFFDAALLCDRSGAFSTDVTWKRLSKTFLILHTLPSLGCVRVLTITPLLFIPFDLCLHINQQSLTTTTKWSYRRPARDFRNIRNLKLVITGGNKSSIKLLSSCVLFRKRIFSLVRTWGLAMLRCWLLFQCGGVVKKSPILQCCGDSNPTVCDVRDLHCCVFLFNLSHT